MLAVALAAVAALSASDAATTCKLTKQISGTKCTPGANFGCNANNATMWITGGCRGVFDCHGIKTECWSVSRVGTVSCACDGKAFKPPSGFGPPPPAPGPRTPFVPMDAKNLNGQYFISETGTQEGARRAAPAFKDYPGGARYFDVYSPPFSTLVGHRR